MRLGRAWREAVDQRRGAIRGSAATIGAGLSWTAAMISVLSIPRRYRDVIASSGMPELVRREPTPNTRHSSGMVQLGADSG